MTKKIKFELTRDELLAEKENSRDFYETLMKYEKKEETFSSPKTTSIGTTERIVGVPWEKGGNTFTVNKDSKDTQFKSVFDTIEYVGDVKVRVTSSQSEALQKELFSRGYSWFDHQCVVHLDKFALKIEWFSKIIYYYANQDSYDICGATEVVLNTPRSYN